MAQRMESVAPPGGVMLSDSTARLVEAIASWVNRSWCASRVPTCRCPRTPAASAHAADRHDGRERSRPSLGAMGDWRTHTDPRRGRSAARVCRRRGGPAGNRQEPTRPRGRPSLRSGCAVSRCSPPPANPTPATSVPCRARPVAGQHWDRTVWRTRRADAGAGAVPRRRRRRSAAARRPARHRATRTRCCPTSTPMPAGAG